jgi:hypothetical protein
MFTGLEPHQLEMLPDFGICIPHCQELAKELLGTRMLVAINPISATKINFERDFTNLRFIPKVWTFNACVGTQRLVKFQPKD